MYFAKRSISAWSVSELADRASKPKRRERFRLIFAACWTALTNGYLEGFLRGRIYTGGSKHVCVPGLNCYSCPGAFAACPIGALQATLSGRRYSVAFFVTGMLLLFGAALGRIVCGFLCPFGLVQDLLHKIPFPKKLRRLPRERVLRCIRFAVLGLFVILLPSVVRDVTGMGEPWFRKYICPSGTLFGGIPNVLLNPTLRGSIGPLFWWKIGVMAFLLLLSIVLYRPFCRYLCPLGAVYGLCNPVALIRYEIKHDACVKCGQCEETCPFGIRVWEQPNSIDCIRCGKCRAVCPTGAIAIKRILPQKQTKSSEADA